eukprot:231022_1
MSNTHSHHFACLKSSIQSSKNVQDMVPFLQMISMTQIQDFLMDAISQLDANAIRTGYFNALSIMDTLPNDIIQHIESFNSEPTVTTINKAWNQHYNTNYNRLRKRAIKSIVFEPNIGVPNSSNSWHFFPNHVMKPNEEPVDEMDPMINIDVAMSKCEAGDTFFIHSGTYDIESLEVDRNVQFIGVGNDVRLTCESALTSRHEDIVCVLENVHACFENIIFDFPDRGSYGGVLHLSPGSKMWLRNCTIMCGRVGVLVSGDSSLHVQQCRFQDGSTAIFVSAGADALTVVDSVFTNCGRSSQSIDSASFSCIEVEYPWDTGVALKRLELKCIGNIFDKNLCLHISEIHDGDVYPNENTNSCVQSVLKYNKILPCQIKSNMVLPKRPVITIDPNDIYHNIRKVKFSLYTL